MKTGKVLLGIATGIAAGTAIGLLLAPSKGSSTRRSIKKMTNEYSNALVNKFNDFIEVFTSKFDVFDKDDFQIPKNGNNGNKKVEKVFDKSLSEIKQ